MAVKAKAIVTEEEARDALRRVVDHLEAASSLRDEYLRRVRNAETRLDDALDEVYELRRQIKDLQDVNDELRTLLLEPAERTVPAPVVGRLKEGRLR